VSTDWLISHNLDLALKLTALNIAIHSDIFPTSLDYPLVRAITTLIGRYPFILPFFQASKMILHLAFDGMYWMFWITVSSKPDEIRP